MPQSKDSSVELQSLWFIEGVPLWVKKLALWGLVFLGVTIIFELINRRIKKGVLKVKENSIEIYSKKRSFQFLFDDIKEIAFVSPIESRKYKVFFKLKENKIIIIKLSDYSELDELTDSFSPLADKDIKIRTSIEDPYWLE